MKILAFGASNSTQSINRKLALYTASLVDGAEVVDVDLNDYQMELYSQEYETEFGVPEKAQAFLQQIADCDGLIISFAEHNGTYTVAYKNLLDWCSRIELKLFQHKAMLVLAASPGPGGAISVFELAERSIGYFGGELRGSLSFPNFHQHFDVSNNQVTNAALQVQLQELANQLA